MKAIVLAVLVAMIVAMIGFSPSSAAPASGASIAQAAGETSGVQQVWWDRFGRWHPNRRVFIPGPICRTVRVCGRFRCGWVRRCY